MVNPSLAPLSIDFYKADHRSQYNPATQLIYSNFTPRSARLFKGSSLYDNKVVVFGIQMFIIDYLQNEWDDTFFDVPRATAIAHYKRFMDNTLGVDTVSVDHIADLYDLGYLPICIKALEEGTRCPIGVPILTIENTLPEFFWLTNYLESVLSAELWKPMTYATIAYEYRRVFERYADLTGASKELIPFQLHDFSFRGASCREESMKSGIGFLTSSYGTDSCLSIVGAETWYNADITKELVGTSVPATEHSVMTTNIAYIKEQLDVNGLWEFDGKRLDITDLQFDETHTDTQRLAEIAYIWYLITEVYPTGIVSIVADSFDFWYMMEFGIKVLKPIIEARQPNALGLAKVVFRPDSGNPIDIICGTGGLLQTPEAKGAIECLYDVFGSTTNSLGFKHLNPRVGLIYGDSITIERQEQILAKLAAKRYATDCIVLGVGSYSLCMNSRDTLGFAMKATYTAINDVPYNIYKDPATDAGTKRSAKGLLAVIENNGELQLIQECSLSDESYQDSLLTPVYIDGCLERQTSLSAIRAKLHPKTDS